MGIAATLHQLTGFGVLIQDVSGQARACAGACRAITSLHSGPAGGREVIGLLRTRAPRSTTTGPGWRWPSRVPTSSGLSRLLTRPGTASKTDLAALEYAATVLSVELARLHSLAEAELRSRAARERDIAQARAAEWPPARPVSAQSSKPPSTRSSAWTSILE